MQKFKRGINMLKTKTFKTINEAETFVEKKLKRKMKMSFWMLSNKKFKMKLIEF